MITLDLPVPPSVNRLRRINYGAMRKLARWHRGADAMVTAQWAAAKFRGSSRPSLLERQVEITIALSETCQVDPDNTGKALLDYLVRIEIISDDRARFVRRLVFEIVAPELAPEGVRVVVAPYPAQSGDRIAGIPGIDLGSAGQPPRIGVE